MSSKSVSMLVGEDKDNTHSLQRETSDISFHLDDFPKHIHIFVVDSNFNTLLDMKKIMGRYPYQVSVETDGEKALGYLTMCKHDINLVVWDFNMPGVNGFQALKNIGLKLGIPVVIMSDDSESELVMETIINGACGYITKPVPEEIIANMWQHIVRRGMVSKPEAQVQSNLAQCHGLDKGKAVSMFVDQEHDMKRKEKKEGKRTWTTWTKVSQPVQPDLVQTNGLDQENDNGSNSINQENDELNIEKKDGRSHRKDLMTWDAELHQKFLDAIKPLDGIRSKEACPKGIHECLQRTNVQGLTRANMGNHLQKHHFNLDESRIPKYSQLGLSNARSSTRRYQRSNKGLLRNHSKNVKTASSSSSFLTSARAVNPIQQNQYQKGYLPMNSNQLITNKLSPFHQSLYQDQPQSSSHPFNYVMNNEEPRQASGTYLDHHFNKHQPQQEKYQSDSRLLNYLMGNKEPGQASNTNVGHLLNQHQPQQPRYQSFSHLLNYRVGNEEPGQASCNYVGPLHQQQQQSQQYQSLHQFNYVVGNEEPGQASGTNVGPLHKNPQQYQSPHHFNYLMSNEEPGQAFGAYVGDSLHQNQQQSQQYQSSHQFNSVMSNEEHGQAFGTYVGPLHQNQQQPYQYQSPHQYHYVVGNEEPEQDSGMSVRGLEPTYPSVPQPQQSHESYNQFNYGMSNGDPQQASSIEVTGLEPTYPSLPQPQEYQSSHQFDNVMSNEELLQASSIGVTGLELTYPNVPQPQLQPQQYQSSHEFNHVMSSEEPQQASDIGIAGLELTYLSVPSDPFEGLLSGYDFSE